MTDESNKHLLFIDSYRDDEMDEIPVALLESMRMAMVPITKIHLGGMDEEAMDSFVSERLRLPRRLIRSLSEIVWRKSLGNPFFAAAFLEVSPEAAAFAVFSSRDERTVALTPRCSRSPKADC